MQWGSQMPSTRFAMSGGSDWAWNARLVLCSLPVRPGTGPERAVELAERLADQGYNVALLGPYSLGLSDDGSPE